MKPGRQRGTWLPDPNLLTTYMAAERAGVLPATIRCAIRAGTLRATRVPGPPARGFRCTHAWAITSADLDAWASRRLRWASYELAEEIRAAYAAPNGPTQQQLADRYGISRTAVTGIVNHQTYRKPRGDRERSAA